VRELAAAKGLRRLAAGITHSLAEQAPLTFGRQQAPALRIRTRVSRSPDKKLPPGGKNLPTRNDYSAPGRSDSAFKRGDSVTRKNPSRPKRGNSATRNRHSAPGCRDAMWPVAMH